MISDPCKQIKNFVEWLAVSANSQLGHGGSTRCGPAGKRNFNVSFSCTRFAPRSATHLGALSKVPAGDRGDFAKLACVAKVMVEG